MNITTRISIGNFNFIELQDNVNKDDLEENLKFFKDVIEKHSFKEEFSPEIALNEKFCKKCGSQLVEKIGISKKNNEPFHYIKCINNKTDKPKCDYIEFLSVSKIEPSREV